MWSGALALDEAFADLRAYGVTLRRNVVWIALWLLTCLGVAVVYTHVLQPEFIASVRLVLKPRHIALDGSEEDRQFLQMELDGVQAETELSVIRSEQVLRAVFDELGLADDPELRGGHTGVWMDLSAFLHRFAAQPSRSATDDESFARFDSRVRTLRLGHSYVLEISYLGGSPGQAARIVNAITSAYVRERIRQSANVQPGATNLSRRIAEARAEISTATEALANGAVPARDMLDADVRVLGPAVEPLGKAYPRLPPLLLLAAAFGIVTSFLAVGLRRHARPSAASQCQLVRELGVDTLHLVARPPRTRKATAAGGQRALPGRQGWRVSALGTSGHAWWTLASEKAGAPRVIGLVSCEPGGARWRDEGVLAGLLARGGTAADTLDLEVPGAPAPVEGSAWGALADHVRASIARHPPAPILLVRLPALDAALDVRAVLPLLDLTLLTIEARRTSLGEIEAGVRAARVAASRLIVVLLDRPGRRRVA